MKENGIRTPEEKKEKKEEEKGVKVERRRK